MEYKAFMNYGLEQPWLPFSEMIMDWEKNFHELMLNDHLRMVAYKTAIVNVVKPGDVVLDLGAGTGILSQWALEAGAKMVYAIEMDLEILKVAVERMNHGGYWERFIPINRLSYAVQLPEKVDVIISEIIGNLADNEDFQPIIQDAMARFLKPEGRSIPMSVSSYVVPVASIKAHESIKARNVETINSTKYSLERLLKEKNTLNPFNMYYDTVLPCSSYLSTPSLIRTYEKRWDQSSVYSLNLIFEIERPGVFTGFKGYFTANLDGEVVLDISGDDIENRATSDSWKHAFFPIQNPISVQSGDTLKLNFSRFYPQESNNRFKQIYRWQGLVRRGATVIGQFDQCLDESLLVEQSNSQPSLV